MPVPSLLRFIQPTPRTNAAQAEDCFKRYEHLPTEVRRKVLGFLVLGGSNMQSCNAHKALAAAIDVTQPRKPIMRRPRPLPIQILLLLAGCSELNIPEARLDSGLNPDTLVEVVSTLPEVLQPIDNRPEAPPAPDLKPRGVGDASSLEATIAPPIDTRPGADLMVVVGQDTKPVDTLPAVDMKPIYTNANGWSPDPANDGACCLSCESNYPGCLQLARTTPYCSITIGGDCWAGALANGVLKEGSVWPQCLPLKANGGCR